MSRYNTQALRTHTHRSCAATSRGAFAAILADGSVVTWGNEFYGGYSGSRKLQTNLRHVIAVFGTAGAFAAIRRDGSVVTWGSPSYGADSSRVEAKLQSAVVVTISCTKCAFAALREDGSVVTWGGGGGDGCEQQQQRRDHHHSTGRQKRDNNYGGDSGRVAAELTSNVIYISATSRAFAALRKDGSVVTWGSDERGGDSSMVTSKLTNIVSITASGGAFAALREDGSVVGWGSRYHGATNYIGFKTVVAIHATQKQFVAILKNGSVEMWGGGVFWGHGDFFNSVRRKLRKNAVDVFVTDYAFAALCKDGSVVTWGHDECGGDSSGVNAELNGGGGGSGHHDHHNKVINISGTGVAFAATRADGSVVTWGSDTHGGDSSHVASRLNNVVNISASYGAFAAVRKDGSVVSWGDRRYGGGGDDKGSLLLQSKLKGGAVVVVHSPSPVSAAQCCWTPEVHHDVLLCHRIAQQNAVLIFWGLLLFRTHQNDCCSATNSRRRTLGIKKKRKRLPSSPHRDIQ